MNSFFRNRPNIIFENPNNFFQFVYWISEDSNAEGDRDEPGRYHGRTRLCTELLFNGPNTEEHLKVTRLKRAKPSSKGLVKYFASDHFKGIGIKTAQR